MLVLPISLVVSLILGFQLLRLVVRDDRPRPFSLLLGAIVAQGIVISLSQYYGVTGLRILQPVTASIIPPLAWITFLSTAVRPVRMRADAVHLAVPVVVALCVAFVPLAIDAVLIAVFAAYGAAILLALRHGPDALPRTRLDADRLPGWIWAAIGVSLILSAVSDALIALAMMTRYAWLMPAIISAFSSFYLLMIGALSLSQNLAGKPDDETGAGPADDPAHEGDSGRTAVSPEDARDDARLMDGLTALLDRQELYLDPDLTLARLAKRLGVPAKQLSTAINRSTGNNVSRHINGYRIRRACDRLAAGDTVTAAMLDSGFNTKSNFNREFLRVTGMTPSAWQARGND